MKKKVSLMLFAIALLSGCNNAGTKPAEKKDYPISAVPFTDVKLNDHFWAPRIKANQDVTIPIALHQCEITGRVDNFRKAAGLMEGYFNTEFPFDDTDIYKILEGASYSIQMYPSAKLEAKMDSLIELVRLAQEEDGYLFTARTAGEPGKLHGWVSEKRWEKTPDLSHELYNCGHLYEAAVAHYQATGKRSFLDIAIKSADLLVREFGPGKLSYEPGHQIVEMGLAKLYRVTGKKEYLELAKFFLDLKGNGVRGAYCQSHKPVTEQDEAVGHAVRAVYMYSGMADVAALTGDVNYQQAIDRIWDNVVTKKYYITGGIGALHKGEAFGDNYELPNHSAYCETCASIGNVYWNHRMFLNHGDAKYYDVLERTLYNGVISGINLRGDRFFYPNPLESDGNYTRSEWFGCACCPSNMCRFMASVPGYVYGQRENDIYVNLYANSEAKVVSGDTPVNLVQTTNYPWDGKVDIVVTPREKQQFNIKLRIPGWARNNPVPGILYTYLNPGKPEIPILINGQKVDYSIEKDGYVSLNRTWNKEDKITLSLPMDIHRTVASDQVEADKGRVSIERGPLLYCLEETDNGSKVLDTVLGDDVSLNHKWESGVLGGVVTITSDGLTAIPYYAWDNRGKNKMAVWLKRK